ncbi:hypothetical protein V9T40_012573 [Parthenolecanium corni]|uniref:Uncharacterized protein n=1 Tax=Parthenolecanium corni TaxID=536013 RepID=A0AAN9XZF9_9HEMI
MKVVCSPTILAKYDANNINELDIAYMNKLNGGLRANGDLKISARDNDLGGGGDDGPKTFIVGERRLQDTMTIADYGAADEGVLRTSEESSSETKALWPDDESICSATAESSPKTAKSAICANVSCASDSGLESAASSWDKSMTEEVKELALSKLEEELQDAREVLKLRDEEVGKLRKIRQDVENELLELTASLFQASFYYLCYTYRRRI